MSSPRTHLPDLTRDELALDPHEQFARWMDTATELEVHEPVAMALATVSPDGRPSARMVLLRAFGPEGYVWFTNYTSRKASDLAATGEAALLFHWAEIGRQVRIEGSVQRAAPEVSDAYFASRDRRSQIGAWASDQSHPLPGRDALEDRVRAADAQFGDGPVPRPEGWGGFVLTAKRFEFWQHRENRLHDRFVYTPADGGWEISRLAP